MRRNCDLVNDEKKSMKKVERVKRRQQSTGWEEEEEEVGCNSTREVYCRGAVL
jgi:hypothetical protein